jgi:acyl-CoA thioesterase-1
MESRLIAGIFVVALAGCGDRSAPPPTTSVPSVEHPTAGPPDRPTIVFLGTSLTAGLGVDPDQAYPALIQSKIDSAGLSFEVQNRGNSGETSAGALTRLGWILQAPPRVLVIETGANDGLRGQDPDSTKANIQGIIDRTRARDSTTRIVLVQMEAMPNLGRRYVARFHAIYPELAAENRVTLVPFLLDGVAGVDSLNQADGIHPTPRGHQIVARTVWKALRPVLEGAGSPARGSQVMCVTTPCP